jgi:hypothetical protein
VWRGWRSRSRRRRVPGGIATRSPRTTVTATRPAGQRRGGASRAARRSSRSPSLRRLHVAFNRDLTRVTGRSSSTASKADADTRCTCGGPPSRRKALWEGDHVELPVLVIARAAGPRAVGDDVRRRLLAADHGLGAVAVPDLDGSAGALRRGFVTFWTWMGFGTLGKAVAQARTTAAGEIAPGRMRVRQGRRRRLRPGADDEPFDLTVHRPARCPRRSSLVSKR